jgi:competence protein ComEC
MVALVIGEQNGITQADWTIFARTGISHLISISGLHITMIAAVVAKLLYFLWRHSFFTSVQLPLWLPAQKIAALAGAMSALVYVALAGFGVPSQRTLIMVVVIALAMWFDRVMRPSLILAIALRYRLLNNPISLLLLVKESVFDANNGCNTTEGNCGLRWWRLHVSSVY